jgi:hypothetical protein
MFLLTMYEDSDKWRPLGPTYLLNKQLAVLEESLRKRNRSQTAGARLGTITPTYSDISVEMDNAILYDLMQLLFRDTERWLDFVQSVHKVVAIDLEFFYVV